MILVTKPINKPIQYPPKIQIQFQGYKCLKTFRITRCENLKVKLSTCSRICYLAIEGCLVNFESETVLEHGVLINIQPRTIGTSLSLFAIVDDPLVVVFILRVINTFYMALDLWQQFVADVDVAVRRPAYRYFFISVLHLVLAVLVLLTWTRSPKILQSQSVIRLAKFFGILWLHLHEDVNIADIHEHVWFEHSLTWIHLLEHAKAYLKISN